MARQLTNLQPGKTYKTVANLEKAVKDIPDVVEGEPVRYMVCWTEEGRCYPVFIGMSAVQAGLFHKGFICVA